MRAKSILVLAPHTDDAELGCGGTIAKLSAEGCLISVAAFSVARESLPAGYPEDTLEREFAESMRRLNVVPERQFLFDYPVRRFPEFRQPILEDMVKIRNELKPDLILLPSSYDIHQDHSVIHMEGLRAFKISNILGYELPWNQFAFETQLFVSLEKSHMDQQWHSLQAYESQLAKESVYFDRDRIESLAKVRGAQISTQLAEAYEVIRIIW